MRTLRLSAAFAALILTASTVCAAVIDFSNVLGPSGRYTSQAHDQNMLGGQPMNADQQAYANQEDQLRQLGFRAELGGDIALGQMFYHMAYGMTLSPSALDLVSGGSGLGSSFVTPRGLAAGSSHGSDASSFYWSDGGSSYGSDDSSLLTLAPPGNIGIDPVIAIPEASTWAMMLLGFAGLAYAGWRGSRKLALRSA